MSFELDSVPSGSPPVPSPLTTDLTKAQTDIEQMSTKLSERLQTIATSLQESNAKPADAFQSYHDQQLRKRGVLVVSGHRAREIVSKGIHRDKPNTLSWYVDPAEEILTLKQLFESLKNSINQWFQQNHILKDVASAWQLELDRLLDAAEDKRHDNTTFGEFSALLDAIAKTKLLHIIIPRYPYSKRVNSLLHSVASQEITESKPPILFDVGMESEITASQDRLRLGLCVKAEPGKFLQNRVYISTETLGIAQSVDSIDKSVKKSLEEDLTKILKEEYKNHSAKERKAMLLKDYNNVKTQLLNNQDEWEDDTLVRIAELLLKKLYKNTSIYANQGLDIRKEMFDLYNVMFSYASIDQISRVIENAWNFTNKPIFSKLPKKKSIPDYQSLSKEQIFEQQQEQSRLDQMRIFARLATHVTNSKQLKIMLERVFGLIPDLPRRRPTIFRAFKAFQWDNKFIDTHEQRTDFLKKFADDLRKGVNSDPDPLLDLACDFFATVARRYALSKNKSGLLESIYICEYICEWFKKLDDEQAKANESATDLGPSEVSQLHKKSIPAKHVLLFHAMSEGAKLVMGAEEPVAGKSPGRKKAMDKTIEALRELNTVTAEAEGPNVGPGAVVPAAPYFVGVIDRIKGVTAKDLDDIYLMLQRSDPGDPFVPGSLVSAAASMADLVGGGLQSSGYMRLIAGLAHSNKHKNMFSPNQPSQLGAIAGMLETQSLVEGNPDPKLWSEQEVEEAWNTVVKGKKPKKVKEIIEKYLSGKNPPFNCVASNLDSIFDSVKVLPQYEQDLLILALNKDNGTENVLALLLVSCMSRALSENNIARAEALAKIFLTAGHDRTELWETRYGFPYKLKADTFLAIIAARYKQTFKRESPIAKHLQRPNRFSKWFKEGLNRFVGVRFKRLGREYEELDYFGKAPQFHLLAKISKVASEYCHKGQAAGDALFKQLFVNDAGLVNENPTTLGFVYLQAAHFTENRENKTEWAQKAYEFYERGDNSAMMEKVATQISTVVRNAQQETYNKRVRAYVQIRNWVDVTSAPIAEKAISAAQLAQKKDEEASATTKSASEDAESISVHSENSGQTSGSHSTKKSKAAPDPEHDKNDLVNAIKSRLAQNAVFASLYEYLNKAGLTPAVQNIYFVTKQGRDNRYNLRFAITPNKSVMDHIDIEDTQANPTIIPCKVLDNMSSFGWKNIMYPHNSAFADDEAFNQGALGTASPVILIGTNQGTYVIKLNTTQDNILVDYDWLARHNALLQRLNEDAPYAKVPESRVNGINIDTALETQRVHDLPAGKYLDFLVTHAYGVNDPFAFQLEADFLAGNANNVPQNTIFKAFFAKEKIYFRVMLDILGLDGTFHRLMPKPANGNEDLDFNDMLDIPVAEAYPGIGDSSSFGAFLHAKFAFESLIFLLLADYYKSVEDKAIKNSIVRILYNNYSEFNFNLPSDIKFKTVLHQALQGSDLQSKIFDQTIDHIAGLLARKVNDYRLEYLPNCKASLDGGRSSKESVQSSQRQSTPQASGSDRSASATPPSEKLPRPASKDLRRSALAGSASGVMGGSASADLVPVSSAESSRPGTPHSAGAAAVPEKLNPMSFLS